MSRKSVQKTWPRSIVWCKTDLIEVVSIEDGMPYYRIASEFAGPLEPTGPGR